MNQPLTKHENLSLAFLRAFNAALAIASSFFWLILLIPQATNWARRPRPDQIGITRIQPRLT